MNDVIVEIARTWIGTPYRHQQAVREHGCDCLGLLRGVWAEYYNKPLPEAPPYVRDWAEQRATMKRELMIEAAQQYLDPATSLERGDVVLYRIVKTALVKHCAIVSEVHGGRPSRVIHAYSGNAVREDDVHPSWLKKEQYYFRFPERNE